MCIANCSATGPRDKRGEKGQAADDHDDADQKQRQTGGRSVGSVPAERGTICLAASDPAIASTGTITKKRPTNIASANVRL